MSRFATNLAVVVGHIVLALLSFAFSFGLFALAFALVFAPELAFSFGILLASFPIVPPRMVLVVVVVLKTIFSSLSMVPAFVVLAFAFVLAFLLSFSFLPEIILSSVRSL